MISFYPGPSRVHDEIPQFVKEAFQQGMLSMNHRSPEFMRLYRETAALLTKKLGIPPHYKVLFTGSATECWEVIAQSLVREKSLHIFNGAFGEKWHTYTRRLKPLATAMYFDQEIPLPSEKIIFPTSDIEIICLTQNETSNGTQVSNDIIKTIQKNHPAQIIAVDATSSMAGIRLDFSSADVWFASVQKCFGLPAGLAVMILSPKAIARVQHIQENSHYNSLAFLTEMMAKWQTSYTPNVLGIYLLCRTLQNGSPIKVTHRTILERFQSWQAFFKDSGKLKLLIQNPDVRSMTVITIQGDARVIEKIKSNARKKGFLLGEGYGVLKKNTFRLANFPALKTKEIRSLMNFMADYL